MDKRQIVRAAALFFLIVIVGCAAGGEQEREKGAERHVLSLPELNSVQLGERPLRVVASTSIIGDVVAQVGGDAILLTTLVSPGQDPHSYAPAARDMTAVADADVIFVNGWGLEESLVDDLDEISGDAPIAPVSAGIVPLMAGADAHRHDDGKEPDAHDDDAPDPHVWFDVQHVVQWVHNIERVLSTLDPAHAAHYAENAEAYRAELDVLAQYVEAQLVQIAPEKRFIVTNHNALSYLTNAYGFELIGTVIPAASTLAEPAPTDLANLLDEMRDHGVCTIFTENIVNDVLARTLSEELETCDAVSIVPLYTDALEAPGSAADSYIGMYQTNIDVIVNALK